MFGPLEKLQKAALAPLRSTADHNVGNATRPFQALSSKKTGSGHVAALGPNYGLKGESSVSVSCPFEHMDITDAANLCCCG
jgi:hypothetical protein